MPAEYLAPGVSSPLAFEVILLVRSYIIILAAKTICFLSTLGNLSELAMIILSHNGIATERF